MPRYLTALRLSLCVCVGECKVRDCELFRIMASELE